MVLLFLKLSDSYTVAAKRCREYGGTLLGLDGTGTNEKLQVAKKILAEMSESLQKSNHSEFSGLIGLRVLNNKQLVTAGGAILPEISEINLSHTDYSICYPFCTVHMYESGGFHVENAEYCSIASICMKGVQQAFSISNFEFVNNLRKMLKEKAERSPESIGEMAEVLAAKLINKILFNGASEIKHFTVVQYFIMSAFTAAMNDIMFNTDLSSLLMVMI